MEKLSMKMKMILIATLWSIEMMAVRLAHGSSIDQSPEGVEKWFKELPHAKEKLTKLRFFVHDNITGKNPTDVQIAQANITSNSSTLFGATFVFDDPMTLTPHPKSKIIGRSQGIFSLASQEEISTIVVLNFVFTDGTCNGSTLSLLGSDPFFHMYREMPILGGTGVFRLARGIATVKTYTVNTTTLNDIIEYYILVLHY